ncbi:hypothetical protein BWR22_02185 [Lacinutrix venerupis]|uniref:DUF2490 domain-containing protein n=2 Tax=Lacinutrix venerupis TaxID=1486034 RepID=A0AAC9LKP8_9FLAO|nr:hypothetical protein BWR22_02185 [Lacinutrix venerupis]
MGMYYIKLNITIVLFLLGCTTTKAQNYFSSLGEHEISVNHKVSGLYNYNFSISTRHYIYNDAQFINNVRQLDFKHFSTYNLSLNNSISFGFQYRNRDWFETSENEIRLTQQFNTKRKIRALRLGHRIRAEQRIQKSKTVHRFRYRCALDFPLNGEKIDIGETYIVASNEALYSISKSTKPELDYRITSQIGWLFSAKLKLQFGLEYRFEALNVKKDQKLHVLTSAVFKI